MIRIEDVTKVYRMGGHEVRALDGVSLTVDDGDFLAIMGPSGSGKSTLAHIIGLLDVPTSGSYQLNGREVAGLSEDELAIFRREEIGFIFQQFNLLPRMSALENVALPRFYTAGQADLVRAQELLNKVGLASRAGHRSNELSGGQQQRVAIARALINRPRMVLADEPTGNLDSASEKEILAILRELNAQGITIVMVTHEDEIGRQAKRLIRMRDGKILSDERLRPHTEVARAQALPGGAPSGFRAWLRGLQEHLRQGYRTLTANKVRTALSMLGILIGVAAVVTMLAIGRGAQQQIESQLSSLGSNLLVLRAGAIRMGGVSQQAGATSRITIEDVLALRAELGARSAGLAPNVNGGGQVVFQDHNWNTQVQGTWPTYAELRSAQPAVGRFFTQEECQRRDRVAVIGMTVARQLFAGVNPIGETIRFNRVAFQVIGVLPEKGGGGFRDQDDIVLIPLETAMHRVLGKEFVDSVDIQIKDGKSMEATQAEIIDFMVERKRIPPAQQDDAFQIFNLADIQNALSQTSKTMSILLAAIAAISLLVGGIGIMNIMLVSVTERTREIGLRKAVGAKRADILMQFLTEAVVVSTIGGLLGIAVGWGSALLISAVTHWTTSVSAFSVVVSFVFSASIGVVFGSYPARKASRLNPIDALRYE